MRCCTTLCSPVSSTRLIRCVVACQASRTGSAVMRSRTALSCVGPLQPAAAANGFAVAPRQGSPPGDVQQMPRWGLRRRATVSRACGPTQGRRPPDKRSSKSRCVKQAASFRPCGNGDVSPTSKRGRMVSTCSGGAVQPAGDKRLTVCASRRATTWSPPADLETLAPFVGHPTLLDPQSGCRPQHRSSSWMHERREEAERRVRTTLSTS